MIMASIEQQWILVPRIFAALENPKWPHPKSKVGSLLHIPIVDIILDLHSNLP